MAARRALNVLMTVVLVLWAWSASALDRSGAIDVAKRQVKGQCTLEAPCTFNATLHEGNWHVRIQFTKRNSPKEKPFPNPEGHAILIINQTGKVIGRMESQ